MSTIEGEVPTYYVMLSSIVDVEYYFLLLTMLPATYSLETVFSWLSVIELGSLLSPAGCIPLCFLIPFSLPMMCSTWIVPTMTLELLQSDLSELLLCFKEAAFQPLRGFPSHYVSDPWACASRTRSMCSETS